MSEIDAEPAPHIKNAPDRAVGRQEVIVAGYLVVVVVVAGYDSVVGRVYLIFFQKSVVKTEIPHLHCAVVPCYNIEVGVSVAVDIADKSDRCHTHIVARDGGEVKRNSVCPTEIGGCPRH